MATYSTSYLYNVSFDSSTFTYSVNGSAIIAETLIGAASEDYFYIDENLTIDGVDQYIYQGYHGNGVLVLFHGNYMLFSNDADLFGPVTIETTRFATCFAAGVRIATPDGERAVEELAMGDLVLTSDGRVVPVKWIGYQSLMPLFGIPEAHRPVIIALGALGENLPARDLRVTSDHALLLEGLLVQAGALVNGTSIRRMTAAELGERFVVYHIELENHELVVAEGVPAETFVDNVSRRRFDNYAEFEALYGTADAAVPEMDLPRVKSARQLPARIRAAIEGRADRIIGPAAA